MHKNNHCGNREGRRIFRKPAAALAAAALLVSLAACSGGEQASSPSASPEGSASMGEMTLGGNRVTIPTDEVILKPSEMGMYPEKEHSFPYLGMDVVLPDSLVEKMQACDVVQFSEEEVDANGSLSYALLSWGALSQEQKDAETPLAGDGIEQWKRGLTHTGALGVYRSGLEEQLNALTGCDQHQKLGESADGAYSYYLSSNSKGDAGLEAELENIEVTLKDMVNMEEGLSFFSALPQSISGSVGEFSTTDIQGTAVDQTIFQEHTLTLVNVFTTWCSPCVEEIPELEKLRADMAEQGVGVIGIVMDTRNEAGEQDSEALQKAQILAERSGAQFPFLIPDETALHGLLDSIDTVPQTFFVDREGNIVGETYLGGHTYDEWKAIVEQELGRLGGDA